MKAKHIFLIIIAIAIISAGFFIFPEDSDIVNIESEGVAVVAFGDSLVEGVGTTKGNNFVDILSKNIGATIINEGVSGDTTADGLLRVDDAINHNPKLVILLLGGNDAIRDIPKEQTFYNLRQIIERIQNSGSAVLLVGVQSGILRDVYKKEFEKMTRDLGTGYVPDILDGIIGKSGLMADPIHPNNEGHKLMAEKIEPVLREILYNQ